MRVLERRPELLSLEARMLRQVGIYYEILESDDEGAEAKAAAYWNFVMGNYRDEGHDMQDIAALEYEADETYRSMQASVEELVNGR
jgi:hypothetical protein